jgi:hypothetical protein
MWYTYIQNNSGGSFIVNDHIGHYVLIEADSTYAANRIAEDIGIYFDGCDSGRDCDCCGDRWTSQLDMESVEEQPKIWEESAYTYRPTIWDKRSVIYLYHKNGRRERITHTKDGSTHEPECG